MSSWRDDIAVKGNMSTPSKVNKFFDMCVQWMSESKGGDTKRIVCSDPSVLQSSLKDVATSRSIGLSDTENVQNIARACVVCSNPTSERCTGSPFTRAYIINICASCKEQVEHVS